MCYMTDDILKSIPVIYQLHRIIDRLDSIIRTLEDMKKQEKEYWETWKKAKKKAKMINND